MTISKTQLLAMGFTNRGVPFVNVGAKSSIDAKEFDFVSYGQSFWGPSNDTTPPVFNVINKFVRYGLPFQLETARATINASDFDYVYQGGPFWVEYILPGGYNTTQFFMIF